MHGKNGRNYRGKGDSPRDRLDQITTIYVQIKGGPDAGNASPRGNKRSKFQTPKEFPMRTAIRDSDPERVSEDSSDPPPKRDRQSSQQNKKTKKRKQFDLRTAIRESSRSDSYSEQSIDRKPKKNKKSIKINLSDSSISEREKLTIKKRKFAFSDSSDHYIPDKKPKTSKKKKLYISELPPPKVKKKEDDKQHTKEKNIQKKLIKFNPIQSLELTHRKLKDKLFDDSVQPINLKIIANPSHPKFLKELSEVDIRLWPNQFDQFFSIITKHLRESKNEPEFCIEILNATESALNSEEAVDSLMNSGLLSFLPYSSKKLAMASCNLLKVPFQFKPEYFQESFEPMMNSLIKQIPCEMSLSLFQFYASSFEYIENPWPILDLLFKNKEIYLNPKQDYDMREYLAVLSYLITNHDVFRKYRMGECRLIFMRVINDHQLNPKTIKFAFKTVIELFDDEFGRMISITSLFNDLKEQTYEKYAVQLLNQIKISSIPTEEPFILQLVNTSHHYEDAFLILQKILNNVDKNESVASILLSNSRWIQFGLPTFSHTLLLFENCIKFNSKHLLKRAKNLKEIPVLFQSILKSEISDDIEKIPDIMDVLNYENLEFLDSSDFFYLLIDKLSDESKSLKSYLKLLNYLTLISYSSFFLELIPIIKYLLKHENHKIAHLALKILANINQYKRCNKLMVKKKVEQTAKKYCNEKNDRKYIKMLEND